MGDNGADSRQRVLDAVVELGHQHALLLLHLLAVANVLNHGDEIVDATIRLPNAADGETCPDDTAVLANIALLDAVAVGFADECLVAYREVAREIVRVCEVLEGPHLEFL